MKLDKTTMAIFYLVLLGGVFVLCAAFVFGWTWRGVPAIPLKLGSIGLLFCRPFMVFRNWNQSGVRG